MAKAILLGDTHVGVRNDSPLIMAHQRKFFYDVLFPYMKEHNIKRIIQMGDLGDKRKGMSFSAKSFLDEILNDSYSICGASWDIFHGNHDQFHRNDGRITLQNTLLKGIHNVTTHNGSPSTIIVGDVAIDLFPWINSKDVDSVKDFLKQTTSSFACGHFEFDGFEMYSGVEHIGGMKHSMFKQYDTVWSGHFHTQSKKDNIHYIGTPYDLTWSDEPDTKGFHVFDSDTKETVFVPNPNKLHMKIEFDSTKPLVVDFSQYANKLVKVIVQDRTNDEAYESFLMSLNGVEPANVIIIDSDYGVVDTDIDIDDLDVTDTLSILLDYADSIDDPKIDNGVLKMQLTTIYNQAVAMGNEL